MGFYGHLRRLNTIRNGGARGSLVGLVAGYGLSWAFARPLLVKMLFGGRYRRHKKLLYTVVTGDYDRLNEIPRRLSNWEYRCYTDNPDLCSTTWEIHPMPNESGLDSVRLSRRFKILNHLVDSAYDLSVYIDANIRIRGDLDAFVAQALPRKASFGVLLHPFLNSLAEEVAQCIAVGKDREAVLRQQFEYYTSERGFEDPFPHVNARMMIRRAGDEGIRQLMEIWFEQLLSWSRRDQVAFNYALSQCRDVVPHYIPYWIFRRYFKKMDHH